MASQTFTAAQVLTAAQMNTLANTVDGYATTATAAGTTTLTVASYYQQFFTGSTTQTVVMPVASTLVVGWKIRIVNNSSGIVTVKTSDSTTIYAVPAGGDVIFTCILASGTTAASWDYKDYKVVAASGSMTLLQTLSCTTSTTTSAAIAGTYKAIVIYLEGGQLNGEQIQLRFNSDTSSIYGTSINASNLAATDSVITLSEQNVGNVATNLMKIEIPDYANATTHKICFFHGFSYNGSSYMFNIKVGAWRSTAAITTVTFKSSVGASITATAYIYGVN